MKILKKLVSVLLCVALLLTAYPNLHSDGKSYADDKLYYHLDMGVYVVVKQDGKWVKGGVGEIVKYTLNPTFNNEIQVVKAMPLDEALNAGIWKWKTDGYTTSYGAKTELYYKQMYDRYHAIGQSQFVINTPKGKKISISEAVKLQGYQETYNVIERYNHYLQTSQSLQKVVVSEKNQNLLAQIASLERETKQLAKEIANFKDTWNANEFLPLVNKYNEKVHKLTQLKSQSTTKYTTVEEVITDTKLDVNKFLAEVYKFWGGEAGLKAENPNMWKMMQDMSQLKTIPSGTECYLVFIPTVIEYKVTGKICSVCGKDILNPNSPVNYCTKENCSHYGTPECGCYMTPVPQVTPPADTTGSCTDVIKWSEVKSHTYKCSGCKTKTTSSGKKVKYCPGHICNHVYTYQSKLSSAATLNAAKPNGNATTFKSGYGFTVNLNNNISTSQISNAGSCGKSLSKANEKKPVPPASAEVRTNWTVKLKDSKVTQPMTVALAKGAITATTSKFVTAANPMSHYKNAQIYTDVALKGTKKKPVKHTITVYTYGGGVNGVQFCKSIPLSFTINGNMYEDDWTVDSKM